MIDLTRVLNGEMETTPEQVVQGAALVRVLSAVLDRLVCANVPLALADPGQVTKFHALKAPGIGIHQYLERIQKYASCSNECFILALIYIDRLIQRNNFLLTEFNVHRVVITAILLGAKFFDDAYYNNAYYAKVGGVLVSEMNGLEVDFLFRINFSLHVTPELFHKYREELLSHSGSNEDAHKNPNSPIVQPLPPAPVIQMQTSPPQPNFQAESVPQQLVEKSHNNFITPSPPPTSAQNVSVPTTEMVGGTAEPYLQRANSLPQWQQGRCSPSQPVFSSTTPIEPYYVAASGITYPIHHGNLIHHNHAKVEHGYYQGHSDAFETGHHRYFMGGAAHILTRCPGGS